MKASDIIQLKSEGLKRKKAEAVTPSSSPCLGMRTWNSNMQGQRRQMSQLKKSSIRERIFPSSIFLHSLGPPK